MAKAKRHKREPKDRTVFYEAVPLFIAPQLWSETARVHLAAAGLTTTNRLIQIGHSLNLAVAYAADLTARYAPPMAADIRRYLAGWLRRLSSRRARAMYLSLSLAGAIAVITLGTAIATTTLNSYANDISSPAALMAKKKTGTTILDRNGQVLFEGYGAQATKVIKLGDLPKTIKDATLAAEDPEFYAHPGFSWKGTARAAWVDLTHGPRRRRLHPHATARQKRPAHVRQKVWAQIPRATPGHSSSSSAIPKTKFSKCTSTKSTTAKAPPALSRQSNLLPQVGPRPQPRRIRPARRPPARSQPLRPQLRPRRRHRPPRLRHEPHARAWQNHQGPSRRRQGQPVKLANADIGNHRRWPRPHDRSTPKPSISRPRTSSSMSSTNSAPNTATTSWSKAASPSKPPSTSQAALAEQIVSDHRRPRRPPCHQRRPHLP
jgi:hypothetical protein